MILITGATLAVAGGNKRPKDISWCKMNKCKNGNEGILNKVFVKCGIQFGGKEHATVQILYFYSFLCYAMTTSRVLTS